MPTHEQHPLQVSHISLLHCNPSHQLGCVETFKELRTETQELTTMYTETL